MVKATLRRMGDVPESEKALPVKNNSDVEPHSEDVQNIVSVSAILKGS